MLGAATPRSVQGATPPPASALRLCGLHANLCVSCMQAWTQPPRQPPSSGCVSFLRVLVCTSVGARLGTIRNKPRSANPGIKAVLSTYSMFMPLGAARARSLARRACYILGR